MGILLLALTATPMRSEDVPSPEVPPSPTARLEGIKARVQKDLQPRLREAVAQPEQPASRQACAEIPKILAELAALPAPPALSWVDSADRYRFMGFLETMLARVEGARLTYQPGVPGRDNQTSRLEYARSALDHLAKALDHYNSAMTENSGTSPELKEWMRQEHLLDHILHVSATAHAIVWQVTKDRGHRRAAKDAWSKVSESYIRENSQPSPELASALDLFPFGEDPRQMQTILWVGLGLLLLTVVLAVVLPQPTSFQMFVFRLVAALGAGGIGANIPGVFKLDLPAVSAGGALALFGLVWLVNPPKLARNLAGNDPK